MSNTNVRIVEAYIEQVINQKHLDRLSEFCSEDCIIHAPPYVGLGVNFDDSSGDKFVLAQISPNSPAHGHLQVGDELVRVRNGDQTWETMDEFRDQAWSCGWLGAEVILTVRRHGNLITLPLRLGEIDQFDVKQSEYFNILIPDLEKHWQDIRMDIKQIFGMEDWVVVYAVNRGTSLEYNRSAIWAEMDMFKLKDGRITEFWYVENILDQLKQVGYQIRAPVRETA